MATLEIFGFNGSTYVRTALMVCEEKGVEYALQPLEFGAESHRKRHPFLKMPALRRGDVEMFETAAIATYIDAIGPGPTLQPDAGERGALMWQWVSSSVDYLYDPLVRSALSDEAGQEGAGEARKTVLEALETGLANRPFFAGEALSLADLFIAPMIAYDADRHSDGAGSTFEQRPRLVAWYDRVSTRDSFKRTAG